MSLMQVAALKNWKCKKCGTKKEITWAQYSGGKKYCVECSKLVHRERMRKVRK